MGIWTAEGAVANSVRKAERVERVEKFVKEAVRSGDIAAEQGAQSIARARRRGGAS